MINGKEYEMGEVLPGGFYNLYDGGIILNGVKVEVGQKWFNRAGEVVEITDIRENTTWPINSSDVSYSMYGIYDSSYRIGEYDLESLAIEQVEVPNEAEQVEVPNEAEQVEWVKIDRNSYDIAEKERLETELFEYIAKMRELVGRMMYISAKNGEVQNILSLNDKLEILNKLSR